jgi:exoribonuclease R
LNFNEERLALVIEMVMGADGALQASEIYRAYVRNHAKLTYNSVAAWLEGRGSMPEAIATVRGLEENLRLQDAVARRMKNLRHLHGALSLATIDGADVGDRLHVQLIDTNVERGYIDFKKVNTAKHR